MSRQQETAGHPGARVEPDQLEQDSGEGVEPSGRGLDGLRQCLRTHGLVRDDPLDPAGGAGRRLGNLDAPRPVPRVDFEAKAQRGMTVQQRAYRTSEPCFVQVGGRVDQHRLAEVADRSRQFAQPVEHRRLRDLADRPVLGRRNARRAVAPGRTLRQATGESGDRAAAEHVPRDQPVPGGPRAAHHVEGADAVPAEHEEVLLGTDLGHTEHLGEHRAQHPLIGRGGCTSGRIGGEVGRGQGLDVEFSVGCQRQPLDDLEERGKHVGGQLGGELLAQPAHRGRAGRRRAFRGEDHVRDQPRRLAVAVVVHVRPAGRRHGCAQHHHGGLRDPSAALDRRSHLTGLDPEAADLHLVVFAPEHLDRAVRPPAPEVARTVHPLARGPEGIGDEPQRGQRGLVEVAPAHPHTRHVDLAAHPDGNLPQRPVEHVDPGVPQRPARTRRLRAAQRGAHRRGHGGLGLAVYVAHHGVLGPSRHQLARQRLTRGDHGRPDGQAAGRQRAQNARRAGDVGDRRLERQLGHRLAGQPLLGVGQHKTGT